MHSDLVAVVVTHNRLEQLKLTVARLLEAPPEALLAIVVVDNASDDGTEEWLNAQIQQDAGTTRLEVLRCAENIGGAGGFARGIGHARARFDPDWMLVLDDDARPAPGALAAFHHAEVEGWDAVAAAVYHPDGSIATMNRPGRNPLANLSTTASFVTGRGDVAHLGADDYVAVPDRAPQQVDWATFVGLFLSRAAIARVGLPDARLFIYADDALYTFGLTEAGGRIGFFPHLRFEHDCTTLQDGTACRLNPLWKTYYYHRNQLFLYRALSGRAFVLLAPLLAVKWAFKLRHHGGARLRFLRLFGWALRDGMLGRRKIDPAQVFAAAERR